MLASLYVGASKRFCVNGPKRRRKKIVSKSKWNNSSIYLIKNYWLLKKGRCVDQKERKKEREVYMIYGAS